MAKHKIFRSRLVASVSATNPALSTSLLFDAKYKESPRSAIDEFLNRLSEVNKLCPHPSSFDPYMGQLVLLGAVAAVESYLRKIFRTLIDKDAECQSCVVKRDVTYGAALHLPKELLPEAILERISFISFNNIVEPMKELLGVKGEIPPEVEAAIRDYVRVCHLRHCAVHRYGKLGASNAIALGLNDHLELLEKPLKLDYGALQNALAIATGLTKTINNYLFNVMLSRLPESKWTGVYAMDRELFVNYYKLFADKTSMQKTAPPKKLYDLFQKQRTAFNAGRTF